jgi:hypothetical protein
MTPLVLDSFSAWVAVYDAAVAAHAAGLVTGTRPSWADLDPDELVSRSERNAIEQIARQRVEGYQPAAY